MVALSDSTVISESSALTVSPGLTRISITGTSLKSPMSGTNISFNAMLVSCDCCALGDQTLVGSAFSLSIPYFRIASATTPASIAPSSASAFSAVIATK